MTFFQALLIGLFAYLGSKRTPWFFGVTGGWNMIGRPLMAGQPDYRRPYLRPWHETVRRHIRHDIRACVILHSQRQSAVILTSWSGLHPVRHFLLHHHSNTFHRHMLLKQSHNDRGCDIIWEIGHHLHRLPAILLFHKFSDIHF